MVFRDSHNTTATSTTPPAPPVPQKWQKLLKIYIKSEKKKFVQVAQAGAPGLSFVEKRRP
jgi:hypothetical protein